MKVLKIRCSIIAKILAITFLLEFVPYFGFTQSMNCGFDVIFEGNMSNGSTFYELFYENEESIIDAMNDPQMLALLNGTSSYTIPVVVHVMHLGEPEGVGSNISDAQIIQAINDLNATFANASNNGVDIGIQFCLAERTPDNQSTDGIVRVNASGICAGSCYGSGMTVGGPLAEAVKAASIWPNQDYVNIWVVHSIIGALGYATFPNSPSAEDGIVIDDDYFGIGGSNVLSHEAGHFLNLFHTFQGDCPSGVNCNQNCATSTVCPTNVPCDNDPNNDLTEVCCRVQGDRVCDTPPHKRSCSTCDPTGSNSCDNNSSNSLFVHNFMDYSSLSCMDRFTDGQRMRMRCALMDLRSSLMNSLGCTPACTSVIANFDGPVDGMEGETLCFTNTSTGANNYIWEINNESQSNTTNFCYQFNTPGSYELCLTASNNDCTSKKCRTIYIIWQADHCDFVLPECEKLYNGNFENVNPYADFHESNLVFNRVCNWYNRTKSPNFFIGNTLGNAWVCFINNSNRESIGTTTELDLVAGYEYLLSFEYSILSWDFSASILPSMQVGLSQTLFEGNSNSIIWEIKNPGNDELITQYPNGNTETVHRVDTCFTYLSDMGRYLYVDGIAEGGNNQIIIRNMSINSCACSTPICNPNPVIIYSQDSCSFTFQAMNDGDPGDCYWDFGDGTSAEGCEVTHEYIFGGTFNVCLTIACDEYTQETVCDSITVSIDCENCVELELNALASKCDDNESGSYMTKIDFIVPKGTKTCNDGLFVWSNDAHVSVTSFDIENLNPTNDEVVACFNLTPYTGIDLESQNTVVYVTLCDSLDNMICYTFNVKAASCENCLGDITVTAACVDPNPFDGEYIYTGTVNITFPADGFQPCNADPLSSEIGYSHSITMNGSGNQATIDFTINTEREGDFNASSLLCFFIGDIQYCYTLNIEVEPCPIPPTDCSPNVWSPKTVYCSKSEGGTLTYNFSMGSGMIPSNGYHICDFGVQGTLTDQDDNPIDGGLVQVNTGTQSGSSFIFNVDITVPCGYEGGIVVLRLYFCDERGDLVCYYFPLILRECIIDCKDKGKDGSEIRSSNIHEINILNVSPNPTHNSVLISIENATSKQHNLTIYDLVGNKVLIQSFSTNIRLDLINLHSGIHFVSVTDDEGNLIGIEKLIILK